MRPAQFCHCISCTEEMVGIRSYSVREICSPCGGHALDGIIAKDGNAKQAKA